MTMEASRGGDPELSRCPEPIAIVGMGCRWPGGVHDESQLWEMLREKRSGYSEFKKDWINVEGFYHPKQNQPGSFHMRGGCFLEEDPRLFDNGLFKINAVETRTMDPAQRKLLEVTFEAFENAGEPWENFAGSRTGVFVGNFMSDHQNMQFRDADNPMPYVTTGGDIAIHSNRINYTFNLKGPSLTLDTACSSAMYALHLAVLGIRNGDCDAAIVAGSNLISDPGPQMFITKLGALSPTSVCHTFDASADGYARAEGVGALYIMPLSRAVAGSYPIRAVIRGTAINANGESEGISYPSPIGQETVIRQAYKNAGGLDPALTGYFEAHGTGTPVGDPIEVSAIGRVFSKYKDDANPLLIGSIKPNLGHSESASAIASIMKVVLALERGEIPPTRGITQFNPRIDFKTSRTKVVTEVTQWPLLPIRRASVNSFGYGGANAHVILEHVGSVLHGYSMKVRQLFIPRTKELLGIPTSSVSSVETSSDEFDTPPSTASATPSTINNTPEFRASKSPQSQPTHSNSSIMKASRRLLLLVFSANDEKSLRSLVRSVGSAADNYEPLHLAHTLANRRSRFPQRAFFVVPDDSVSESLSSTAVTPTRSPLGSRNRIGFVFTGQGAQWPCMGRGLFHTYPKFKESIRHQDRILTRLSKRPPWRIEDILMDDNMSHMIHEPMVSQTVCTALQIALVELLSSWKIKPSATVGHSSGEIAAAYASGSLNTAEAIVTAYFRGYTVSKNERQGAMLAVGLGDTEVKPYLASRESEVKIAAINSPNSVTLSGETYAIEQLSSQLQHEGVFNRILKTGGNAYHSHHMKALGGMYEHDLREGLDEISKLTESMEYKSSALWVSSVIPESVTDGMKVGPSYWRQNLESPVLFRQAVEKLMKQSTEHPLDILLEIGPHAALAGPVKQIMQVVKARGYNIPQYLGTLKRGEDDLKSLLELGGNLFLQNAPIQIDALNDPQDFLTSRQLRPCLGLPNYNYNYGPVLFHESRLNKEWRLRKHLRHDLLGVRELGSTPFNPSWRNIFRLKDVPWLGHHRLTPQAIFPAAGFLSMAVEAAAQCHSETADPSPIAGFTFRNVMVNSTLEVPDTETGTEVVLNMQKQAQKTVWLEFRITSLNTEVNSWVEHCTGSIKIETSEGDHTRNLINDKYLKPMDIADWYTRFKALGLEYGPCFQALSNLKTARNRASANVELAPTRNTVTAESDYWLHPASLDNCLQLANIAAYSGKVEQAKQAYIPVMFDGVTIWNRRGAEPVGPGYATAEGKLRGSRGMHSRVLLKTQSGKVLLDMDLYRGISYDGKPFSSKEKEDKPQYPFSRLCWKPDIDTLSNEKARELFAGHSSVPENAEMIEKLDKLFAYLVVDVCLKFHEFSFSEEQTHLNNFMDWIRSHYARAEAGKIPFGLEAISVSPSRRCYEIDAMFEGLGDLVEAKILRRIFDNLSGIFSGQTTGLEIALQDKLLVDLYTSGLGVMTSYPLKQGLVDLLAHKNPRMKILELGGGTGGATTRVLETLEAGSPFKRYQDFTFTDLTPTFVSAAQQTFSGNGGMKFSVLNIESDPLEQDFEGEYDLVIASQVLHATTSLSCAVGHIRKLLKPGGKLLLLEFTNTHPISTLALGTFPYYWNGSGDGRSEGPLAGRERWHTELVENGFSGIDIVLGDDNTGGESGSVILTTAIEQMDTNGISPQLTNEPEVVVITRAETTALAHSIAQELLQGGLKSSLVAIGSSSLDGEVAAGSRVICLVDIENPCTISNKSLFDNMKGLLSSASSVLWVFAGDVLRPTNPTAGLITGLLRTVTREMPHLKLSLLGFGTDLENSAKYVQLIVNRESKLYFGKGHTQTDDLEIYQDGCVYISRLAPEVQVNEHYRIQERLNSQAKKMRLGSLGPIKVTATRPGLLSSLQFEEDLDMLCPLPDDWVEIRSEAIDINMKDLAVATGRFDLNTYSTACCGIVNKVGSQVKHFQVGDRVCGFAPGNYGNFVRVPAIYQQRMDPTDSPVELASLPISYMTALYALRNLAHIQKGETVLIQSAAGALGLAALRLAQHLGAEIFATVGNSAKAEFLQHKFGIPPQRIFSREPETPTRIWTATEGKGIDVIISSTAGEDMQEFWRCIAPLGRFIEVGRLDVLRHGKLPLEVFKRNATFSSFDIALLCKQKPKLGASLMAEVADLYRKGVVKPIDCITTFDISELQQAMMHMAKGIHMGKIIVTYKNPDSLLQVMPSSLRASFDPQATYVLVGCVTGVGYSINNWMIERGAKYLVHLSRSGPGTPQAKLLLQHMETQGVEAVVLKCDVTVKSDVEAAITQASSTRPIKGILHAAAVFEDVSFEDLEYPQLQRVLGPKVEGTINLHEATLQQPLDFFTMTSSIVTIIGTATQASYSAANSFQDAFARFRRAQGLPAQSFAMGMILDIGFASSREDIQRSLMRNGVYGTPEPELIRLLDAVFTSSSSWNDQFDPLAGAHLLVGLEPSKIYELNKTGVGAEFTWSSDPRFGRIIQAIQDHHELQQASSHNNLPAGSVSGRNSLITLAQKTKSVSAPTNEDMQKLYGLAADVLAERLAKLLFVSRAEIDIERDMADYGIDSMISAELRNWLFKTFDLNISFIELVKKGMSVQKLSNKLAQRLLEV